MDLPQKGGGTTVFMFARSQSLRACQSLVRNSNSAGRFNKRRCEELVEKLTALRFVPEKSDNDAVVGVDARASFKSNAPRGLIQVTVSPMESITPAAPPVEPHKPAERAGNLLPLELRAEPRLQLLDTCSLAPLPSPGRTPVKAGRGGRGLIPVEGVPNRARNIYHKTKHPRCNT